MHAHIQFRRNVQRATRQLFAPLLAQSFNESHDIFAHLHTLAGGVCIIYSLDALATPATCVLMDFKRERLTGVRFAEL